MGGRVVVVVVFVNFKMTDRSQFLCGIFESGFTLINYGTIEISRLVTKVHYLNLEQRKRSS